MEWTLRGLIVGIKKQIDKMYIFLKPYYTWCMNKRYPAKLVNWKEIPIIINNRNRLTCLTTLIDSLEKRGYQFIYVIDNASTYPPLLNYYTNECTVKVFRLQENLGHLSLWRSGIIKQFEQNYFVYTDPDVIPIDTCPDDFLSFFRDVMQRYPLTEKVGFSLQIDDLPDCFDKKADVVAWEKQFWSNVIEGEPKLYKACIDTTFALYRPWTFSGGNLNSPNIRVGFPYVARHLPWYNDSNNLDEEEKYYLNTCKTASYWVGNSKR